MSATSVITLAELQAGVLAADTTTARARRLGTLRRLAGIEVLPIDEPVAAEWARAAGTAGRVEATGECQRSVDRRHGVAHDLPLLTQDADFGALAGSGLRIIQL